PVEMPFHLSAQAKLEKLAHDPLRVWHLKRCAPSALRVDALAAMHGWLPGQGEQPAGAGARETGYAVVLRSGFDADDAAAALSASTSPHGHIHHDGGSVVLGTRGEWLIADPGYQQYMPTS